MTDLLAPDSFSLLESHCARTAGALLVPARPRTRGAGIVFKDILAALGKDAAGCGALSHQTELGELTSVWLRAEQIQTVVLHAADRVAPRALHVTRSALDNAGIQLVALSGDDDIPDLTPSDASPLDPPPAHLAHLSRAVQPYFAAAGLLEALTGSPKGLERIMLADVDASSQTVQISGRDVAVPAGAWRYIEAQRVHSVDRDRAELFSMFGRRLDRAYIAFGAFKALAL